MRQLDQSIFEFGTKAVALVRKSQMFVLKHSRMHALVVAVAVAGLTFSAAPSDAKAYYAGVQVSPIGSGYVTDSQCYLWSPSAAQNKSISCYVWYPNGTWPNGTTMWQRVFIYGYSFNMCEIYKTNEDWSLSGGGQYRTGAVCIARFKF